MTDKVIDLADKAEFQWGEMDCCQFAGKAVEHVTGKNPMDHFAYETEQEAKDIIASYGGLYQAICRFMGEPVPVDGGKDGDVLYGKLYNGEPIVGTQYMGRMIVKSKRSVVDWPIDRAIYRWSACQKR